MYSEEVVLKNETGLHARPASLFVKEASKYSSDVKVIKEGKEYNAKSIMGILSMGAAMGEKIKIEAIGEDAEEVVKSLVELVNNKFGE
ncbi:HPr family phosphocarrier protein [Anaerosalibacter massiliensis]|uniref:Phosphocarrier protein HPr n=1 Tax=Anaerosalibacter massiliensis TaxID=1347392 RepID=A0A9X2MG19_9FIRM|nr:HPr family phosphocarrier protein [Anaerosalibacter massiliensis]MCR2043338.1 HPr family phosphocarrier protein [Anaerosalibacter massiliensis]